MQEINNSRFICVNTGMTICKEADWTMQGGAIETFYGVCHDMATFILHFLQEYIFDF